jgi:hypothetical protein
MLIVDQSASAVALRSWLGSFAHHHLIGTCKREWNRVFTRYELPVGNDLRSFQGPRITTRASVFMLFAFLDEFGHIGPYLDEGQKYRESPVFGLAGIVLPKEQIRGFATFFLQQKEHLFKADIARSGQLAARWEKKGTSFIRRKPVEDYPEIRRSIFRILNGLHRRGGFVFYYGREKTRNRKDLNATGLYKTVFAHALRNLNSYCEDNDRHFVVVVDQHSSRKDLLETSVKTMYGNNPCRKLASPPFEVESHISQNIQAADWIATIVGRMYSYAIDPNAFLDNKMIDTYFGDRLQNVSCRSVFERRSNIPRTVKPKTRHRQRLRHRKMTKAKVA